MNLASRDETREEGSDQRQAEGGRGEKKAVNGT